MELVEFLRIFDREFLVFTNAEEGSQKTSANHDCLQLKQFLVEFHRLIDVIIMVELKLYIIEKHYCSPFKQLPKVHKQTHIYKIPQIFVIKYNGRTWGFNPGLYFHWGSSIEQVMQR